MKRIYRIFGIGCSVAITVLTLGIAPAAATSTSIEVWWPTNGATVSGVQPLKAIVSKYDVSVYTMYWQVDGGQLNVMPSNYQDYPHKETLVDLSGWSWHGSGPYTITFRAYSSSGRQLGSGSVQIMIGQAPTSTPTPTPSLTPTPTPTSTPTSTPTPTPSSNNPLAGKQLYVNPYNDPSRYVADHQSWDPTNAALMNKIAQQPESEWFGNWNTNVQQDVSNTATTIANTGALPVFVAYNIPQRDCGGYSAGGSNSPDAYRTWIRAFAAGIGTRSAAVILEPDALASMDCLSATDQQTRMSLLSDAVQVLKAQGHVTVYLDAGNAGWQSVATMASRLTQAGVAGADGFALNVSNFRTTTESTTYGTAISALIGNKHFVMDTGRNGNGPTSDNQWCNPWGRALGNKPTTNTGNPLIDAYFWVKGPSGSDGYCNGGPAAGVFWPDYGLDLARNTAWW